MKKNNIMKGNNKPNGKKFKFEANEEGLKTVDELSEKLMDYVDLISYNEQSRQFICLKVAMDLIVCSCPYDKETDQTTISKELLLGRIHHLQRKIPDFINDMEKEYGK